MRVLALEYALAGFAGGEEIVIEGHAMLRALVGDLESGGYRVVVPVASRFAEHCGLRASELAVVPEGVDPREVLSERLEEVEGAVLIAPAFESALYSLAKFVEERGVRLLGPTPRAVSVCSDKYATYLTLSRAGVRVPRALQVARGYSLEEIAEIPGFPLVVKPVDGVGCTGLSLVLDSSELDSAIERALRESESGRALIQEYVSGVHASASLLSDGERVVPLALNAQRVKLGRPGEGSEYVGGITPLFHPLEEEALLEAAKAVRAVRGLRGYVGVDLVLERVPFVVEINPRLTTSYVGLRLVSAANLGAEIVRAGLGLRLPERVEKRGCAIVEKIKAERACTLEEGALEALARIEGVAGYRPAPGPVEPGSDLALAAVWGRDLEEAESRLEEVRSEVHEIAGG